MPPCLWYNNSLKIVSHASWSTNCSATLAKSFMETLELPKASQLPPTLVPPSRRLEVNPSWNLWCDGHEAALSISPVSTSPAKSEDNIIKELTENLTDKDFWFPISNMSIMDLIRYLEKDAKYVGIRKMVKQTWVRRPPQGYPVLFWGWSCFLWPSQWHSLFCFWCCCCHCTQWPHCQVHFLMWQWL